MVSYKKLDNIYLSDQLYQALITYQKQHGFENASVAVVEILAQFLQTDNQVKHYATVEQMEAQERKVTHLSQQVAQLYQIIASSPHSQANSTVFSASKEYTQESTDFDEVEDEPDEILHEFL